MPNSKEKPALAADPETSLAFQRLVGETFRLNGRLISAAETVAAEYGISTARWQVIMTVLDGELTVPQISRRIGIARQSVQTSVNKLDAAGLIEFVANPDHRRSRLVRLSSAGLALRDKLSHQQALLAYRFLISSDLTAEHVNGLADQLVFIRIPNGDDE